MGGVRAENLCEDFQRKITITPENYNQSLNINFDVRS
jgi:hypothetical protein